jgi:hypothetical protein
VPGGEGCTPGFWKNHADVIRFPGAWPLTGYEPTDDLEDVFGIDLPSEYDDWDLLEALNAGGGGLNALMRHATAALLNAAHPDLDYGIEPTEEIIELVQDAIAAGPDAYEDLKDIFEELNEAVCTDEQFATPTPTRVTTAAGVAATPVAASPTPVNTVLSAPGRRPKGLPPAGSGSSGGQMAFGLTLFVMAAGVTIVVVLRQTLRRDDW